MKSIKMRIMTNHMPESWVLGVAILSSCFPEGAVVAQSGPDTTPGVVAKAAAAGVRVPPGPFAPTWDSLKTNYHVPAWFRDAKFGIFMHWGLYAVPAHASEWKKEVSLSTKHDAFSLKVESTRVEQQ